MKCNNKGVFEKQNVFGMGEAYTLTYNDGTKPADLPGGSYLIYPHI